MLKIKYFFIFLLLEFSNIHAFELNSTQQQPILLELYTSEGCSSCPPAEHWLKKYLKDPKLWIDIIPMAFHVDYWDYIGWKDKLALKENSQRQRRFKKQGLATAVYTPEILQNGHEWRNWRYQKKLPTPTKNKAKLHLDIDENNQVKVQYQGKEADLIYHLVILGFDIQHQIKAGENEGKTLNHQFVVLNHQQHKVKNKHSTSFQLQPLNIKKRFAIVAWVEKNNQQIPLQAVAGWLPKIQ